MKRKNRKQSGNIVPFPGTSARLEQKGQQALEEKRFDEAIRCYSEALRFDDSRQEELKMALLIAYHESGSHEEGIELSRDMLLKGEGHYFDVLDLHVLMLIQRKRYKEVADTLSVLMEEGLPSDRYEHFAHLKALADRMSVKKETVLFRPEDGLQEKMMKLAELGKTDAAPFEKELIQLVQNEAEHPFIQTIALGLLREIGTAEKITVKKVQREKELVPVLTDEAFQQPFFQSVMDGLDQSAGQDNPALYEQAAELVKQYQFLLHPFHPEVSPEKWVEAVLLKINAMYEQDAEKTEDAEVAKALAVMKELDEISAF